MTFKSWTPGVKFGGPAVPSPASKCRTDTQTEVSDRQMMVPLKTDVNFSFNANVEKTTLKSIADRDVVNLTHVRSQSKLN